MSSPKSGAPNAAWVKTTDTANDISIGTALLKSGADYHEKDPIEATETDSVKDATVDIADNGIDETKSVIADAWDHTKEMAENVAHSIHDKGSELCDAIKSGAEAGWNIAKGGD